MSNNSNEDMQTATSLHQNGQLEKAEEILKTEFEKKKHSHSGTAKEESEKPKKSAKLSKKKK